VDEAREVAYVATFLPIRHWWDVPAFLLLAQRVQRQIAQAPGNVAWNASGELRKKWFWTMSAWTDRESVRAFVATEPHATAVRRMAKWTAEGAGFAEWTGTERALDWADAKQRLEKPTFYFDRARNRPNPE
jgi:hypothetical protein